MINNNQGLPFLPAHQFVLLMAVLFIISFIGLFIPIMEVDATQYASMSLELLQSNNLVQFTDLGEDYLDKPPLLFWVSSFFIYFLGNTTFAFKIGSFLMAWASVYFLYRLALLHYSSKIAQLSALFYACSVAFILFTNDIRTDTLLISFVLLAVWQLAAYLKNYQNKHLFIAAAALGLALLAKGPIGFMVPMLAIIPQLIFTKNTKALLNVNLLLVPLIILTILSPMLLGLYEQFGMHGIRFFFWEQSFGRLTGENVWKNDATPFYFLHNIAWAYIPFILFFALGLIKRIVHFKHQKEYISLFGFILPFIALSMSQFKLPHYIYVTIPFAAITTAYYLNQFLQAKVHKFENALLFSIQAIIIFALCLLPYALLYAFSAPLLVYFVCCLLTIAVLSILFFANNSKYKLLKLSIGSFIVAVLILNCFAYPTLLSYQSSYTVAKFIKENQIERANLFQLNMYSRAFHYYTGGIVPDFDAKNAVVESYVYTNEEGKLRIKQTHEIELIEDFNNFNVTRLSLLFLNPKTRLQTTQKHYLIKIKKRLL